MGSNVFTDFLIKQNIFMVFNFVIDVDQLLFPFEYGMHFMLLLHKLKEFPIDNHLVC